jgi:hypothetical protein
LQLSAKLLHPLTHPTESYANASRAQLNHIIVQPPAIVPHRHGSLRF